MKIDSPHCNFCNSVNDDIILSFIVLAAKHHLHGSYWSRRCPNIDDFKTLIGKYEYIERLLALQNDNLIKDNEKWEAYEKQLLKVLLYET